MAGPTKDHPCAPCASTIIERGAGCNPYTVTPCAFFCFHGTIMPEYVTASQLAKRLHVTAETVRRWNRQGRITGLRLGIRPILFDLEAITRALNDKEGKNRLIEKNEGR